MRYPNRGNTAVFYAEIVGRVLALVVFSAACFVWAMAIAG